MQHSGGVDMTVAAAVSHELPSSKHKSSRLAGIARSAATGQLGPRDGVVGAWLLRRRCARAARTCARRESDYQVDAPSAQGGRIAHRRLRAAEEGERRSAGIEPQACGSTACAPRGYRSRPCRPDSRAAEDPYSRADDAALFRYLLRRFCRRRGGTYRVAVCCDLSCTRATDIGECRSGAPSARVGRPHILWQRTRGRAVRPDSRDRVARPSFRRRSSRTALRCRIIAVALPGS